MPNIRHNLLVALHAGSEVLTVARGAQPIEFMATLGVNLHRSSKRILKIQLLPHTVYRIL